MKYLVVLLVLIVNFISVNAQEQYQEKGITVEENVKGYESYFDEAINNPGMAITVEESKESVKLKPLFKKVIKVEKTQIFYNQEGNRISLIKPEPQFLEVNSYLIFFAVLSVVLMIISNLFYIYKRIPSALLTLFFSLLFATLSLSPAFIFALAMLWSIAGLDDDIENDLNFVLTQIFIILYYLSMIGYFYFIYHYLVI